MVIERPALARMISESKKWVMVYGRRKTGKSFLVENFVKYDEYFFVKKDRTIISKKGDVQMSYETFTEVLKRTLQAGGTAVVDEFHRLGEDFFDFLHYTKKEGKLIIISSTLFLSKKLLSAHSSLLGFFMEMPVALIDLGDCLRSLRKPGLPKKQLFELAILAREPIAIDYLGGGQDARKAMREVLLGSVKTIPALTGEIFAEEERSLSAVYEGIMRSIAMGKVVSGEISSRLFSQRLIKKDDPSIVQQYLNNMVEFGLIRKLEVYGKKRYVYKLVSPLSRLFYYADEKYNISERKASYEEVERIIGEMMPRIVEDSVREFLAEKLGLKEAIAEAGDYDVDGCLLKFKKPSVVLEVKWKDKRSVDDIAKAEETLGRFEGVKKILFVPDKRAAKSDILEILDVSDL